MRTADLRDISFTANKKAMKTIVWIFGLVIGIILCINGYVMVKMLYTNPDMKANDVVGYAAMVVMFSLIFFGVRNYRNKQLDGFISFGRAFKTALQRTTSTPFSQTSFNP